MTRIRVLVVDDHAVVRGGLRHVLEAEPGFEVVGEAEDARTAVARARALRPDVVLLDITMPGGSGLQAVRPILAATPETRVLMLSVHDRREYVVESVRAGAHGYLRKDTSPAELRAAVRAVHAGGAFFGAAVAGHLGEALRDEPAATGPDVLTAREREVLLLVARGLTNKQAALQLGIGVRTVETHRDHLMRKLGIRTVAGLTRYVLDHGLGEGGSAAP